MNDDVHEMAGGEISLWIDDGASIHLKNNNKFKDPIELNADDARKLAQLLLKLADQID